MKTNATIAHPFHSFMVSLRNLRCKKLESKVVNLNDAKEIFSNLASGKSTVIFASDSLLMERKETLDFLDKNFKKTENEDVVAKHESFSTSKGNINYLWMYKNYVNMQNGEEIIFADYMTPLRATIIYREND